MEKATMRLSFTATEDEQLVEMVQMHQYLYDLQHPLHNEHSAREIAWQEISQILERPIEECKRRWKNIKDAHRRRKKIGKYSSTWKSPLVKTLTFLDNVKGRNRRSLRTASTSEKSSNIKVEIKKEQHENALLSPKRNKNLSEIYDQESNESMEQNTINENITDSEMTQYFVDPLSTLQKTCDEEQENENAFKNFNLDQNTLNEMKKDLERLKRIVDRQDEDSVDLFFRSLSMSVKSLPSNLINEAKVKMLQLVIDLESQNN